jgi:hypothetical protein
MTAKSTNTVTSLDLYRDAQELCFQLEANEGVTDLQLDEAIDAFLEGSEDKLDRHRYAIDSFNNQAKMYRAEVQRLQGRARMLEGIATRIKNHAKLVLEARCELLGDEAGRKLETDQGIVYLRKSAKLVIEDEDAVIAANQFINFKPVIDKRAMTAAIKAGDEVDGAHLAESTSAVFK